MQLSRELPSHVSSLRRYALVLCRDPEDAEDLVQETLLTAIAKAPTFRRDGNLRIWLFGILHNKFVDGRRSYARRSRARAFLALDAESAVQAPGQEQRLRVDETVRALEQLPLEQRQAVALVALDELSFDEAAAVLEIPLGTLMSRLARGRAALRKLLDRPGSSHLKLVKKQ